jgi:agmatinase
MNQYFNSCKSNYSSSSIVVFGAPYDGTTSYRPGTRLAPNRVRLESVGIETYSPYQDKEMTDCKIHDAGDTEIALGSVDKTLNSIYNSAKAYYKDNKKTLMIGGEHLVSYPTIKACYERFPELRVIHFDAHTDLRDTFLGEAMSHATVIKKVADKLGDNRIFHFGIRSGTKAEFEYAKQHQYIEIAGVSTITEILDKLEGHPIYITLDVDVLDPSIMSGTGTPEAGGISYKELLKALLQLQGQNIVGSDIVELSPDYDNSGVSTATACTLIRELLLLMA